MRITSPGGTDLTFHKEGRDPMGIYSVSDVPGRWDIWPSGMVCCAPEEHKGGGVLVLSPGDYMLVLNQYINDYVYLEMNDGRITEHQGRHAGRVAQALVRAVQLRGFLPHRARRLGLREARQLADSRARTTSACTPTCRSPSAPTSASSKGATTLTNSHIDFPCLNNSYWVDDIQIMENGEFLLDELRYQGDVGITTETGGTQTGHGARPG